LKPGGSQAKIEDLIAGATDRRKGVAIADVTNSMGLEWILIVGVPGKAGIHFHEWINLVGVLAALIEYWLVVGLNTGLGTGLIGIPLVTNCTTTKVLVTNTTVFVASDAAVAASPRAFCPEKLTPAAVLKMRAPAVGEVERVQLTPAQVGLLFRTADELGDPLAALWRLTWYTSARLGELLVLTWPHVNLIDLPRLDWGQLWPLLLIAAGIWVVWRSMRRAR